MKKNTSKKQHRKQHSKQHKINIKYYVDSMLIYVCSMLIFYWSYVVSLISKRRNEKGEYVQWKGDGQDGKNLNILVESGVLDGLTPKSIRENYPHFSKYRYSTFNSALGNCRRVLNNQIHMRAKGGDKGDYITCIYYI